MAEALRDEVRERFLRMSLDERIEEMLRLGWAAVETYASAHGLTREEAVREMKRAAQAGRAPSKAMRNAIG